MTEAMSETLESIRLALRTGDYAALGELTARLEAATEGIAALPAADLRALRERANETASCLAAARNGIRAARRRVAEVAGGPAALSTYDRDGRRLQANHGGAAPKRL